MNYSKPEIVFAGPATAAIQGINKAGMYVETPQLHRDTIAAYEADE